MQRLLGELVNLLPVLMGALIALFGTTVKYLIDRRDKRVEIRRAKLERLTDLTYRIKAWTNSLDSHVAFGIKDEPKIDSPVEELQVLTDVYFPELHDAVRKLAAASQRYAAMAYTMGASRATDGRAPDDANQRINDAYDPVLNAINELTTKIRTIARELK